MSFVVEDLSIDKLLSDLEAKARHPEDIAEDNTTEKHGNLLSTKWSNRVQQASTVLRLFQRQLNDTSPVNCLPVEILGIIFRFVQTQEHDIFRRDQPDEIDVEDGHASNPYMWIAVTHVCHYWRKIALMDAELWKRIRLDVGVESSSHLSSLFLERCELLQTGIALSLNLSCKLLSPTDAADMQAILDSLSKKDTLVKITSIHMYVRHYCEPLFEFLRDSFPNVVDVQISLRSYQEPAKLSLVEDATSSLLARCSSVRRLFLSSITSFPPIPCLTHLILDEACDEMTFEESLLCLKAVSSTLQVLCLKNSSPYVSDSRIPSNLASAMVIPMPHLRHMEIYRSGRSWEAGARFLRFLHNLCLPTIFTLVWDFWFSNSWTEGCIPPEEVLRNVTSIVGCAREEDSEAMAIESSALWLDRFPYSGNVVNSLPNLTSMVLPNADYGGFLEPHRVMGRSSLEDLHLRFCDDFFDAIHMLEVASDYMSVDVFPKLKTITAYTGEVNVESKTELDIISTRFASLKPPLPELRLSDDCTMTRHRKYLGTTYTLRFQPGDID